MTRRDAAWLTFGALASPIAQILAARYARKHWLDTLTKEIR